MQKILWCIHTRVHTRTTPPPSQSWCCEEQKQKTPLFPEKHQQTPRLGKYKASSRTCHFRPLEWHCWSSANRAIPKAQPSAPQPWASSLSWAEGCLHSPPYTYSCNLLTKLTRPQSSPPACRAREGPVGCGAVHPESLHTASTGLPCVTHFRFKGRMEQLQRHSFLLRSLRQPRPWFPLVGFAWGSHYRKLGGCKLKLIFSAEDGSREHTQSETSAHIKGNWRLGKVWTSYPLCTQATGRFQDAVFLLLGTQIHETTFQVL